jgi:3-methyladenine DNA glycosylase AlkD
MSAHSKPNHPEPGRRPAGSVRAASGRATPRPAEVAATIIRTLRSWRDPARAGDIQRYFKNAVVALGIGTPKLRAFATEQAKAVRPVWDVSDAVACCDRLLREPELEIRGTGILILAAFRRGFTRDLLPPAKRWLDTRLDNWALVDSFCSGVLSPLLDRDASVEPELRRWSGAERLWVRRAALVTLVPFARRGRLLDLAYELAGEHFPDPEDLMHKATGWLLREAGKTDAARLRRFLLQHGPAIPRTALRYAIERFPAAERRRLLEQTRAVTSSTKPSTRPLP